MSMLLSALVTRLQEDVPAVDSVPSTTQYENAIKDAIRDFSERCGVEMLATLSVVPGTATYDLAADFLSLIMLEAVDSADGILQSAEGIIPVSATWEEHYSIRNGQITFSPTPTFTVARDYRYKAAWIGTATDPESGEEADTEYATMGEREARIVLLKAQAIALTKQANAQAGTSVKYSFGAVSEDLTGGSESLRQNAKAIQAEYLAECDKYNGAHVAYG